MARGNRNRLGYGALEHRCLLANSALFLNTDTSTLHISAGINDAPAAEFANEITFSIDQTTEELVVDEVGGDVRRFDLSDVSRISYRGTSGNDRFTNQTDIPSRVIGFAGDDIITSGGGDDTVIAANGNDTVFPGNGDDYVAGGQGDDQILEIDGSTGADRFFGGPGNDVIEGGLGADFLAGHEGDDTIRGGSDGDIISGHEGRDELFGGEDRDFIYGGDDNDTIDGESGNDRILGQDGDDTIRGGQQDDSILGGNGNDTIDGGDGNDRVVGNLGNDILSGGAGADALIAGTTSSTGSTLGFDIVNTGDDDAVDFVLAHPADQVFRSSNDLFTDTEVVRRNLQTRFLSNNLNTGNFLETASGLQIRTLVPGTGAIAGPTDTVRVNYSGTFIDGTEFDAANNISFPLNRVIAGWTEGLQLVQEGGVIELAIPASLAYGEFGIPGIIPSASTLLFRVELVEVIS